MSLDELIARMRPRPELYIGVPSLTRLQMFLYGWQSALYERGIEDQNDTNARERLRGFHWYAGRKYHMASELGWLRILLSQVGNDERAALELFWHNWDEFNASPDSKMTTEQLSDREFFETGELEETTNE